LLGISSAHVDLLQMKPALECSVVSQWSVEAIRDRKFVRVSGLGGSDFLFPPDITANNFFSFCYNLIKLTTFR
jgi:hypothetical protein